MLTIEGSTIAHGPPSISRWMIVRLTFFAIFLVGTPLDASGIELAATAPDDVKLAGTLHVPEGSRIFPVVVFTHGSEPGRRSAEGYRRWALPFVAAGIGVLTFDKRGCGDSGGTYVEAPDLDVPAADLNAWVNLLATRDDVSAIGVLGWSQGGWVGPLAASRNGVIRFVVSLSGCGVSPLEQNIFDKTNRCAASGATDEQVRAFRRTIREVWTYIVTGEGKKSAQESWDAVVGEAWFEATYDGPPMMDRDRLLKHPKMTHYVPHASFDPEPVLTSLRVPMLAVFGDADTIVPVDASIAAMKGAFSRAGRERELTIRVLPGADHGLRVNGVLASGYPEAVVDWVVELVL